MSSVAEPKDHAIFVFRQSTVQADFHGCHLQNIVKLSARAAIALHGGRADIASVAVVSSFATKSRMMPPFASDPSTEMEVVMEKHFEGPSTKSSNKKLRNMCHNAARATYNITDQLLYSKMHGRRPLLIFMGTNAFSGNWEQFSEFVLRFHEQYGVLRMAIWITMEEKERSDPSLLCPHVIGPQAFGFFDSYDFVRNETHPDARLQQWRMRHDGHREKALTAGALAREHGCARLEYKLRER